ncbi:MAG: YciI family protein [Candidatus Methylomirabilia bacterium]
MPPRRARGQPLHPIYAQEPVVSVLLLDVSDMDAARTFMEREPFYKNGVYREMNFHR